MSSCSVASVSVPNMYTPMTHYYVIRDKHPVGGGVWDFWAFIDH